jgi:hypothetical protein
MTVCAICAGPLGASDPRPTVRSEDAVYHLACAPTTLLESASEEYLAIVRKGVRYFVEKYSSSPVEAAEVGARFLELGRALDAERHRRGRP